MKLRGKKSSFKSDMMFAKNVICGPPAIDHVKHPQMGCVCYYCNKHWAGRGGPPCYNRPKWVCCTKVAIVGLRNQTPCFEISSVTADCRLVLIAEKGLLGKALIHTKIRKGSFKAGGVRWKSDPWKPQIMNSSAQSVTARVQHSKSQNGYQVHFHFPLSFRAISIAMGILLVDGMLYIPSVNKQVDPCTFDSTRSTSAEASSADSNP